MNTSSLGDRIRKLRTEKELEQKELAQILQVHKGTVSNWENNKRIPDNEMLIKIANYFAVTTDYLLGNTNNRNEINIDPIYRKKLKEILECFIENGYDPDDITKEEFKSLLDTYMKFKGFKKD